MLFETRKAFLRPFTVTGNRTAVPARRGFSFPLAAVGSPQDLQRIFRQLLYDWSSPHITSSFPYVQTFLFSNFFRHLEKSPLNFSEKSVIIEKTFAGVMELVDVTDSKSVGSDTVWVRVPPPAPKVVHS